MRWRFPPVVNGSGKLPSSHFHTSILLLYCGNMLLKGKSWCFQTFPVWKSSFLSRMLEWDLAYYSLVFIDRWIGFIEIALDLISAFSIFIFFYLYWIDISHYFSVYFCEINESMMLYQCFVKHIPKCSLAYKHSFEF